MNNIKIYLICGKARTGKNTIAKIIKNNLEENNYKVCEIQIMRTLKGYIKDYFGWDGREETKPRTLLQTMGTELIKEKLNMPTFHIDRLSEDIKVLSNFFDTFIVDDVRMKDEIFEIKKKFNNVSVILVEKNNNVTNLTNEENNHITEQDLNDFYDYDIKIDNNGNLEELKNIVLNYINGGK